MTPQSIPSLETERSQHPQDAGTLARLGVAYFKAGRFADARPVLDSAVARDPRNGVAAVYLGMTAEQLGDFATARTAYQSYVALATDPALKRTAEQRLALVDRNQLAFQARQALANEASLAAMPPESNTVAVMPFAYLGSDSTLRPLARGFAQLLVTDLAKSRQVRVLERERMQAIVDELKLSDSARTTPQTALRSGRLLRAAEVVQGALAGMPGNRLQVNATVVSVGSSVVKATAQQRDILERLFDLEKQVALNLFANLGIQLSPAEQEAINQRPTQNLQAFLAYSRGLQAEDQGNFGAAQADFERAAAIDPNFRAAIQGSAAAGNLSAAASQSVSQVETAVSQSTSSTLQGPGSGAPVGDALNSGTNTIAPTTTTTTAQTTGTMTTATERNPIPEATGTQGGQRATGTIVIIIPRPR